MTTPLQEPCVYLAPGAFDTLAIGSDADPAPFPAQVPAQDLAPQKRPQSETTLRIDRYLQAAGAADTTRRSRLTAAAARDLLAQGATPSWAEIIAAVDRSLAGEFATACASAAPASARGRIALSLAEHPTPDTETAEMGNDWGTPPRHRQVMAAQDLSLWRPYLRPSMHRGADRLRNVQVSRSAQSLAACLCWLAVVIIP
ncbi:MAG: hypothetical protein ACFB13_09300 [Kiloniellaceae bacterium]